jgi:glycosyltransferase involved in cell wall biosynthesis
MEGVSVVICCHNGASRLPVTLAHLKAQRADRVPWEVILIDNASTDDTVSLTKSFWGEQNVPLRIVSEPRLGTRYARERGFTEALYSIVGFVDDDNWVSPDWVLTAYQIMSADRQLGAVNGITVPVSEKTLPPWFPRYHGLYAVLTEQEFARMTEPLRQLPTAGLCVRKAAWEQLVNSGFRSLVAGRVGKDLSGGEDTELTVALRFSGWKLDVNQRLRLSHFMPARRLEWNYLRKLARGNDASTVLLDGYTEHSLSLKRGLRRRVSESWFYQLGQVLMRLARRPKAVFLALTCRAEARNDVLEVEQLFGRAIGLLRVRKRYGIARRAVREAPWLALHSSQGPFAARTDVAVTQLSS